MKQHDEERFGRFTCPVCGTVIALTTPVGRQMAIFHTGAYIFAGVFECPSCNNWQKFRAEKIPRAVAVT
jgi:predicted RNA-binding Zn-ribbon protein involved in translation (DUF1610 family)